MDGWMELLFGWIAGISGSQLAPCTGVAVEYAATPSPFCLLCLMRGSHVAEIPSSFYARSNQNPPRYIEKGDRNRGLGGERYRIWGRWWCVGGGVCGGGLRGGFGDGGESVRRRKAWRRVVRLLEELEEGCATPVGRLRQVVDAMAVEMHAGLASEGGSKLKMLLTYIHILPTGKERGTYYALDLGTNFRVLRVQLGGQRSAIIGHDLDRQPIPQNLMTSTSEELFDFVATLLKDFVEREEKGSISTQQESRELGFTFSFPVKQTSSSSGNLIKWTKGFSVEDMVGRDVSECLQQAISRKGLDVRVAVLINDTVGTLALGHYDDEDTVAAVIFGKGTNACYLERADAIIKCQGLLTTSGGMVVNMEWGNFWSSHLPRTSYDIDLDADSPNPNDQGFEKMISGMYLGDIVRRVILQMSQESDVFGPVSSKLHVPFILRCDLILSLALSLHAYNIVWLHICNHGFSFLMLLLHQVFKRSDGCLGIGKIVILTHLMAAMHEDDSPNFTEVARVLKDTLEIPNVPLNVRKLVVNICDVVTRRAARLAAAGIVGILKKIGRDGSGGIVGGKTKVGSKNKMMRRTVVAVEGGLYTNYTMFREYLNEAMEEILGEDVAPYVVIKMTKDGSGIGAALLAASHSASSTVDRVELGVVA
ncbi:UNVERIFIED_CONTAM: Hexokinase-3 [Sesamum latifolium]|uniref:Phosphotransferase n=1 Tax=Sesamum latifolium TaxID=2727402 RepID=A0AAW2Y5F4_9LAMI